MVLSETQEKELIQLYWDIKKYAKYLKEETYNPYSEVENFAIRLKQIIGNDEKINSLNKTNMNQEIKDYISYISKNLKIDWIYDEKTEKLYLGLILDDKVIDKVKFEQY